MNLYLLYCFCFDKSAQVQVYLPWLILQSVIGWAFVALEWKWPCTQKITSRRHSRILPHLFDAVTGRILLKPDLYFNEMAEITYDEFGLSVSIDSVRTLEHHADKEPAIARRCLTDHLLPCATTEISGFTTCSNSRSRAGDLRVRIVEGFQIPYHLNKSGADHQDVHE